MDCRHLGNSSGPGAQDAKECHCGLNPNQRRLAVGANAVCGRAALTRVRNPRCLQRKTICLTLEHMAETITIRTDTATEHALDVLTHGGTSRSAAIRQAVLEAAARRERAAEMRRAVLRMPLGEPDGINVADELSRSRDEER